MWHSEAIVNLAELDPPEVRAPVRGIRRQNNQIRKLTSRQQRRSRRTGIDAEVARLGGLPSMYR